MTNRDFDEWLSKFRPSISSYRWIYFCVVYRWNWLEERKR